MTPTHEQDTQKVAVLRKALVAEGMSDKTASKLAKTLALVAKEMPDKAASDLAKALVSSLNTASKEDLRKATQVAEPPATYAIGAGYQGIPPMGIPSTNKVHTRQKAPSAEAPSINKVATVQQETPAAEALSTKKVATVQQATPVAEALSTKKVATVQQATPVAEALSTKKVDTVQQEPPTAEAPSTEKVNAGQQEPPSLEVRLIDRIGDSEARLNKKIDDGQKETRAAIGASEARLNKKIDDGLKEARDELKEIRDKLDAGRDEARNLHDKNIRWLIGIVIGIVGLHLSTLGLILWLMAKLIGS